MPTVPTPHDHALPVETLAEKAARLTAEQAAPTTSHFEFRDHYDTELSAFPGGVPEVPTVVLYTRQSHSSANVYIPVDRLEEVIAGLRDMARQAGGPAAAVEAPVIAYRDSANPRVLLCRVHGENWFGVVPVTANDLPDGGICTFGRLSSYECGRDVLITETPK